MSNCIDNITEQDLNLCKKLIRKGVTLDLPILNSNKVLAFSKIAGPKIWNGKVKTKYISGCYRIWSKNLQNNECYIG